ncbi:MAG: PHP domain-containing protein [Bacteroidales bacterium]|nr:PHP domain-containing protein [Bacteroidales bacterium]
MRTFKADFHVHTVLSPCASLDMAPVKIIEKAVAEKIDILAITDHNSTLHCKLMCKLGKEAGIKVLPGVEITTKEEVHCLAFFETVETANIFQQIIEKHKPDIPNRKEIFGYQPVVDRDENILYEVDWLLISALSLNLGEAAEIVSMMNGIFVPAHIDRPSNSLLANLGFIPDNLKIDAVEISKSIDFNALLMKTPEIARYTVIRGSDAHCIEDIGSGFTMLYIENDDFDEIKMAFAAEAGRKVMALKK